MARARIMRNLWILAFAVLAALSPAYEALAESPGRESDHVGGASGNDDSRALERTQENLRHLERQYERLDELKRQQHPFHSERKLRHELRRNEADQRWLKHERDRIEHELQGGRGKAR